MKVDTFRSGRFLFFKGIERCLMQKIAGFSLIETAIALLIFGIIASLALPLLTTSQSLQRQKITEANQNNLFSVLGAYVLAKGHLPSPSLPSLAGKSNFQKNIGIIPYVELGIPESFAKDGYGNWFTYAINPALLNSRNSDSFSPLHGFCFKKSSGIGLNLKNLSEAWAFDESQKDSGDFIAIVLISHGPKGTGAFQAIEDKRLPVFDTREKNNSGSESFFYYKSATDADSEFSHKVYWVTRNNLMAIYAKTPCFSLSSTNNINRPSNSIMPPASSSLPFNNSRSNNLLK